jgi:hypothetical protein
MNKGTMFRVIAAILLLAIGAAAFLSAGSPPQARRTIEQTEAGEHEFPAALGKHLDELSKTIPGTGGEPSEGRSAAAEDAFMQRAYPNDTISVAQMAAARQAFIDIKGHPFPSGRGRPGTWVSVGPSQALYPFTPFRNSFSYVPNDYYAGGRTTAIAISDT